MMRLFGYVLGAGGGEEFWPEHNDLLKTGDWWFPVHYKCENICEKVFCNSATTDTLVSSLPGHCISSCVQHRPVEIGVEVHKLRKVRSASHELKDYQAWVSGVGRCKRQSNGTPAAGWRVVLSTNVPTITATIVVRQQINQEHINRPS